MHATIQLCNYATMHHHISYIFIFGFINYVTWNICCNKSASLVDPLKPLTQPLALVVIRPSWTILECWTLILKSLAPPQPPEPPHPEYSEVILNLFPQLARVEGMAPLLTASQHTCIPFLVDTLDLSTHTPQGSFKCTVLGCPQDTGWFFQRHNVNLINRFHHPDLSKA